jgi:hypothetical protein
MTKVSPAANLQVEFVQVGSLVLGGFGTKGTLSQHDVRHAAAMIGRVDIVSIAILQNGICSHIQRIVVSTDKHFGSFLFIMMWLLLLLLLLFGMRTLFGMLFGRGNRRKGRKREASFIQRMILGSAGVPYWNTRTCINMAR